MKIFFKAIFWMFIGSLAICTVTVIIFLHKEHAIQLPETFGNFQKNVDHLDSADSDEPFSFAVIGDLHGYGTFEKICAILKNEPLSFAFLLGDCVYKGYLGYHQYLNIELDDELTMPFPEFYVVGDRDVHKGYFTIDDFEQMYGPSIFSFEYRKSLFVCLRILPEPYDTSESIDYLASILEGNRDNYQHVFVFMHVPPPVSNRFITSISNDSDKLVETIAKYNVDYVICGHYHGYYRQKIGNTVYLISGGGGARLDDDEFSRFHHSVMLTVDGDSVTEQIIAVKPSIEIDDKLECFVLAELFPRLRKIKPVNYLMNTYCSLVMGNKKN